MATTPNSTGTGGERIATFTSTGFIVYVDTISLARKVTKPNLSTNVLNGPTSLFQFRRRSRQDLGLGI